MTAAMDDHKWVSLPPIPSPRVFFSTALVDENLFVIGGCQLRGVAVSAVEVFNFGSKRWTETSPMPTKKAAPCVQRADDKLYLFGGVGEDSKATSTCEYFDLGAQHWIALKELPEKLQGISAVARGDKLLLVGGMAADMNSSRAFRCFDPARGTWQSLPQLPTARSKAGLSLIDDKLFVFGGAQGRSPVDALEVFDFRAFKWQKLGERDRPARVFEALLSLGNSRLACVGGLDPTTRQFSASLDLFDVASETWNRGPDLPAGRGDFAFGYYRDQLMVAGGFGNEGLTSTVFSYDPERGIWNTLPSMSEPHASCGQTLDEKKFCVVGGLNATQGCNPLVEVYSASA